MPCLIFYEISENKKSAPSEEKADNILELPANYFEVSVPAAVSAGAIIEESVGAVSVGAGADISTLVESSVLSVLVPELQEATNIPNAMANTPTFNKLFIMNGFF